MMVSPRLPLFILAIVLAGCTAPPDVAGPPGYHYHDANHPDEATAQTSPQAIYNATHGTWLWPPQDADVP